MPRRPGTPKTGGRAIGTPNRRNQVLAERLAEAMGEGWCPVVALARIAHDAGTDLATRVRCLAEVAPYLYPRKKATELALGAGTLEELIASAGRGERAIPPAPPPAAIDQPPRVTREPAPVPAAASAPPLPPAMPAPAPFRMPVEPDSYADTSTPYLPQGTN